MELSPMAPAGKPSLNILKNDGYKVSVAQPPETSYADDQKYTKAAIDAMGGPVVLVGHSYGGSIITEAGNHPNVAALVYIAAFALDEGESCASIEQAVPQASKAFKPDSNGQLVDRQEHFAADFAADIPRDEGGVHGYIAGADLHRLVHPQGYESRLEAQAHLVHGGHRRPIDQSGAGAHDGEARQGQDGRSEGEPCGLHVSPEGNSQAHRRGCHLRTGQIGSWIKRITTRSSLGPPPILTISAEARMNLSSEENTMKDRITIEGRDGAFGAYIARPKILPAPAVVVLQELFGVNADIRKTCDELAEQGFVAVAPDLFWRQEPGVDLSVTSEADWQHGLRLYQAYDRDAGVRDIKDTLDAVAKLPECTGKIAVQGYCLGALDDVPDSRALPWRRCRRRLSRR
jgi:dienelactone hydrolase